MAKYDVYQDVTNRIIEQLENGTVPWIKPWNGGSESDQLPHNAISGNNYSGVNTLLLWTKSLAYGSNTWLTFKQAKDLGGTVKKGEKGTSIVFFKMFDKKNKETGEKETIPMLRSYTVFNAEQCEGINSDRIKKPVPVLSNDTDALLLAKQNGADVQHGGDKACFIPSIDKILMPSQAAFADLNQYEGTLLHELTHWTGHKTRLDRLTGDKFGSHGYAFEELVAEIGSAFLCANMQIPHEELQHADYIANWLKVLKDDKRAIFKAAKLAQQSTDLLLNNAVEKGQEKAA